MSRSPTDPTRDPFHQPRSTARPLPRCRLILTLDRAAALMYVVRTIMELTRYCREESTHRMWEAYHRGQSVLLTTHRERAELLAELFLERGLQVTVVVD